MSADMDNQRERLLKHLRNYTGKKKINDDTRIYQDLGIGGDDAFELLERISADFKIDFSKMKFSDYFPDETEAMSEHIGRLIGFKPRRRPLTVGHMLQAVGSGHWREPTRTG